MRDAEIIQQFLLRERRWLRTLQELRAYHDAQMGKATTDVLWVSGGKFDRLSWLGYYWDKERFWFGYGLHEGVWRPLIEADNRSEYSSVWLSMRAQLVGTWESVAAEGNLYRRLWAPAEIAGASETELDWFKARSRELHEFVLQPGA